MSISAAVATAGFGLILAVPLLGLAWDDYLGTDNDPERRGLGAAFAFADHCEASGWEHVEIDDEEGEASQLVNIEAMNQLGGHRLLARWTEDDDGRGHFVEAALVLPDESEPVAIRTLREANRLVELHGSEAP